MQERRKSIANVLELRLSCTNPSICCCSNTIDITTSLHRLGSWMECVSINISVVIVRSDNNTQHAKCGWNGHKSQWVNTRSGVGVTTATFVCFSVSKIFNLAKYLLDYFNHIYIWQVPLQLSCSDTCQIWMWYSIATACIRSAEKLGK